MWLLESAAFEGLSDAAPFSNPGSPDLTSFEPLQARSSGFDQASCTCSAARHLSVRKTRDLSASSEVLTDALSSWSIEHLTQDHFEKAPDDPGRLGGRWRWRTFSPGARTSLSANCEQLNYNSRSRVTIEDLNTKKGTLLNGVSMQGQKRVLAGDANDIQLGTCSQIFR